MVSTNIRTKLNPIKYFILFKSYCYLTLLLDAYINWFIIIIYNKIIVNIILYKVFSLRSKILATS